MHLSKATYVQSVNLKIKSVTNHNRMEWDHIYIYNVKLPHLILYIPGAVPPPAPLLDTPAGSLLGCAAIKHLH